MKKKTRRNFGSKEEVEEVEFTAFMGTVFRCKIRRRPSQSGSESSASDPSD